MYEEILFFINITSFYYTIIKVISKNIDSIFKLFHSFYRGPGVVTEKKRFRNKNSEKNYYLRLSAISGYICRSQARPGPYTVYSKRGRISKCTYDI